jgi:hypothetical protein
VLLALALGILGAVAAVISVSVVVVVRVYTEYIVRAYLVSANSLLCIRGHCKRNSSVFTYCTLDGLYAIQCLYSCLHYQHLHTLLTAHAQATITYTVKHAIVTTTALTSDTKSNAVE